MEIVLNIITISSFVITVLTFYFKQKRDREADAERQRKAREKEMVGIKTAVSEFQEAIDNRVADLQMKHEKDMAALREDMIRRDQETFDKIDLKRRDDMKRVYDRLDSFEKKYASEVMERIGKLEGTFTSRLEGLDKRLDMIQSLFTERR